MSNAFLSDIPFVSIVRSVADRSGRDVETLDADCKRVWFRIKARTVPNPFATTPSFTSIECLPDNHYKIPFLLDPVLKEWS